MYFLTYFAYFACLHVEVYVMAYFMHIVLLIKAFLCIFCAYQIYFVFAYNCIFFTHNLIFCYVQVYVMAFFFDICFCI